MTIVIPTSYKEGYDRALKVNPEIAKNYIAHTTIGDPLADDLIRDTISLKPKQFQRYIRLGMIGETDREEFKNAPKTIKDFFEANETPPDWVDINGYGPGIRMFHNNTRLVLASMVGGTLVEGFATNIAKSFFLTGRLVDKGIRRLKQNNRHMLDIFMPNGMDKHSDGWVLSIRIRLIHAKIRYLLSQSPEWNQEELGIPLSSANLGFAIASFSARTLHFLEKLGASMTEEEKTSFMQIWRYSGYLMGVPESILYTDTVEAVELNRIARTCEPPPSLESIILASSLINSAPLFAGITQRKERKELANYISKLSRAMIGNELADRLNYEPANTFGVLWKFKAANRIQNFLGLFSSDSHNTKNMMTAFEVSMYDDEGITFTLPDHYVSERSTDW
ncbi:MAG: oxygenase MpaB family protein [Rhodobacteraceae bacterium]|nr:oxygenase MpaB family protein [Paracoccaceae bacterium]MCY4249324.1 oxygenase MpaB family protein [Paracoccaceae bacterium]